MVYPPQIDISNFYDNDLRPRVKHTGCHLEYYMVLRAWLKKGKMSTETAERTRRKISLPSSNCW